MSDITNTTNDVSASQVKYIGVSRAQLTEKNLAVLEGVSENARVIQEIINDTLAGKGTIADGCRKAGIDYKLFFYYTKRIVQIRPGDIDFKGGFRSVASATERIYSTVFGVDLADVDSCMPYDADAALEYVLAQMTPVQATIVRSRANDGKLREIGEELGLTGERVRQIEAAMYQRMRQPSMSLILKYGLSVIEEAKKQVLEEKRAAVAACLAECGGKLPKLDPSVLAMVNSENHARELNTKEDGSDGILLLEDMGFSTRAYNCCVRLGITCSEDFRLITLRKLRHTIGIGKSTFDEIVTKVNACGITLKKK